METLLKSEFAKRLHVSKARVSQMVQKGMPVTAEGKVDVAEALNWIESHIDLSHKDSVARRQSALPAASASKPPSKRAASTWPRPSKPGSRRTRFAAALRCSSLGHTGSSGR